MQKTLSQLPRKLFITLVIIMAFLMLSFYYVKLDYQQFVSIIAIQHPLTENMLKLQLTHYFQITTMQWITVFLTLITIFLTFAHYSLSNDKRALTIGLIQLIIAIYFLRHPLDFYHDSLSLLFILKLILFALPFVCFIINAYIAYSLIMLAFHIKQSDQEKLQYIAEHDSLTGLYNRHQFECLLHQSITKCAINFNYFALFIIDLDNFKQINDTYGHMFGDDLLKQFANQLTMLMRQGDIFARIGGDEFALITTDLPSPVIAKQLADRIFNALKHSFAFSMGIAIYPLHGKKAEELIKNADHAMYHAKKTGKNQYYICPDDLFMHQLFDMASTS